jgi:hypothetical protein
MFMSLFLLSSGTLNTGQIFVCSAFVLEVGAWFWGWALLTKFRHRAYQDADFHFRAELAEEDAELRGDGVDLCGRPEPEPSQHRAPSVRFDFRFRFCVQAFLNVLHPISISFLDLQHHRPRSGTCALVSAAFEILQSYYFVFNTI